MCGRGDASGVGGPGAAAAAEEHGCTEHGARAVPPVWPPGARSVSPEPRGRPPSSPSPGPKRRQRVSRRLIVRARATRLREREEQPGPPREGGAARAPAKGTSGAPPQTRRSRTAGMSNTVCISDVSSQWKAAGTKLMQDLSSLGEIARFDVSLADSLGTMLVTYFDVRCAQAAVVRMASRAEPFQPASHDCRIVSVDFPRFCAKTGHTGGLQDFGEVAHVDTLAGQTVVEFYDLRSAQALLAAAGDCATPVPQGVMAQLPAPPGLGHPAAATAEAGPKSSGGIPGGASEQAEITNKRFQKFDINPDAILRGEDKRTSVMVRHLQGFFAREDFVMFLDRCGLGDRYSFLYAPCREHRNTQARFAFVNFASPRDVHTLCRAVASGRWREVFGSSLTESLAVSYARFQGHGDLVQHFSPSAAFHEHDPETQPIFRPEVLNQSTSVHDLVKVKKALRIPGPPGIAEDVEVPIYADPNFKAGGGASVGELALSSRQLQEAVLALLRKRSQAAAQEESRSESKSEHGLKGSSVADVPTLSDIAVLAPHADEASDTDSDTQTARPPSDLAIEEPGPFDPTLSLTGAIAKFLARNLVEARGGAPTAAA